MVWIELLSTDNGHVKTGSWISAQANFQGCAAGGISHPIPLHLVLQTFLSTTLLQFNISQFDTYRDTQVEQD